MPIDLVQTGVAAALSDHGQVVDSLDIVEECCISNAWFDKRISKEAVNLQAGAGDQFTDKRDRI